MPSVVGLYNRLTVFLHMLEKAGSETVVIGRAASVKLVL